mgnify:CR=1 FL=1
MAIRTKSFYQSEYLTSTGVLPDNTSGSISPADLRSALTDYFDSQTALWPFDGTSPQEGYLLRYTSGNWDATDKVNTSGGFKFGDVDGGNYSEFQEDTGFHFAYGSGVGWDDLKVPVTQAKQGANNLPNFDYTNLGFLFPQDDTSEIAYLIVQFPHAWKLGSTISPHVHYIQDTSDVPVFKMEYKWYQLGDQVPDSWTTVVTSGTVVSYTSGSIHQLLEFEEIDGSHISGVSSIMDIKLYRDDDIVTGGVLVKEFDIHYMIDSYGSRQEYVK